MSNDPTAPATDEVFTDAERIAITDLFADAHTKGAAGHPPTEAEIAASVERVLGDS